MPDLLHGSGRVPRGRIWAGVNLVEICQYRFAEKELLIGRVVQADGLIEDPWVVLETGLSQNQISAH